MKRAIPLLLLVAACHAPRTFAPGVAAPTPTHVSDTVRAPVPAEMWVSTETSAERGAGWLTGVPEPWVAAVNDDGTIRLEDGSGTLIAARGTGDCDELSYPPPVGELAYGDLDVRASEPWNLKIGYVLESASDVYCRDLGDGQVMVLVVPGDVASPALVLRSVQPIA